MSYSVLEGAVRMGRGAAAQGHTWHRAGQVASRAAPSWRLSARTPTTREGPASTQKHKDIKMRFYLVGGHGISPVRSGNAEKLESPPSSYTRLTSSSNS